MLVARVPHGMHAPRSKPACLHAPLPERCQRSSTYVRCSPTAVAGLRCATAHGTCVSHACHAAPRGSLLPNGGCVLCDGVACMHMSSAERAAQGAGAQRGGRGPIIAAIVPDYEITATPLNPHSHPPGVSVFDHRILLCQLQCQPVWTRVACARRSL